MCKLSDRLNFVTISNLLEHWTMRLPAWKRVNSSPALLTIIMKTCNTATEERSWFSIALYSMTLITELVIQDVWLKLNLCCNE